MKRLLIAAALAALCSTAIVPSAHAYDYWNRSGFSLDHHFHSPYDNMFRYYGGSHTVNNYYGRPAPGERQSPAASRDQSDDAELNAKTRKWEAFCQPTKSTDNLGIVTLHYAHEGCDFGRDE